MYKALVILLCLSILSISHGQTLYLSGNINNDTVFDCDTLFITSTVEVADSATLEINGHTRVVFMGSYAINVRGHIRVRGDSLNPVVFTVQDTLGWYDSITTTGGWKGVRLVGGNTQKSADISHAEMWFAKNKDLEGGAGGAFYARLAQHVRLSYVSFIYCRAGRGGAVYLRKIISVDIGHCRFIRNDAYQSSRATAVQIADSITSTIHHNYFEGNGRPIHYVYDTVWGVWTGTASGAPIELYGETTAHPLTSTSVHIVNANFLVNNYSHAMGTLRLACKSAYAFNNIVVNNEGSGIVMSSQYYNGHVINNLVLNNTIYGIDKSFPNLNTQSRVEGNIVWNNLNGSIMGDLTRVSYNIVEGGWPGGEGNISVLPDFENALWIYGFDSTSVETDWRLKEGSIGINMGIADTMGLHLPLMDFVGNPRIAGGQIDIGPYEFAETTGIKEAENMDATISVFPNPCAHYFYIEQISGCPKSYVRLTGMDGKKSTIRLHGNKAEIGVLSCGFYTGEVFCGEKMIGKIRIVVNR